MKTVLGPTEAKKKKQKLRYTSVETRRVCYHACSHRRLVSQLYKPRCRDEGPPLNGKLVGVDYWVIGGKPEGSRWLTLQSTPHFCRTKPLRRR